MLWYVLVCVSMWYGFSLCYDFIQCRAHVMLANVMLMLLMMMMFPRTDVLGPISRVEVAILPLLIARALCYSALLCLHPKPLSHKCAKGWATFAFANIPPLQICMYNVHCTRPVWVCFFLFQIQASLAQIFPEISSVVQFNSCNSSNWETGLSCSSNFARAYFLFHVPAKLNIMLTMYLWNKLNPYLLENVLEIYFWAIGQG